MVQSLLSRFPEPARPTHAAGQHPFEISGLGIAPFKVVRRISLPTRGDSPLIAVNITRMAEADARFEGVRLGKCEHCGTALKHNFVIVDSQGRKAVVGRDCVQKTGDKVLESGVSSADSRWSTRSAKEEAKRASRTTRRYLFEKYAPHFKAAMKRRNRSQFLRSVLKQMLISGWLSSNQITALQSATSYAVKPVSPTPTSQEPAARAPAPKAHVGTVGERMTSQLKMEHQISGTNARGPWVLSILTDRAGNKLTTFETVAIPRGDNAILAFTVVQHGTDRKTGAPVTTIANVTHGSVENLD